MQSQIEKSIPVVISQARANFPFCVQLQVLEQWNPVKAAITHGAAEEIAAKLIAQYPTTPVRIEHSVGGPLPILHVPRFKRREGDERPYRHALWTGKGKPPARGARVTVGINELGPGTVTGYAIDGGYLGVMVLVDEGTRPDWHKQQVPENKSILVFGAELKED